MPLVQFTEEKSGKNRFLVARAQIIDTGKEPTAKGNVSCGGTGGNQLVTTDSGETIKGPSGQPITCGVIMYSKE